MGTAIMLIFLGVALVVLNYRALMKEKNSFKGTLNKAEVDIGDVELEIGKLRKEFAETLLDIQTEIESIKSNNNENSEKENRVSETDLESSKDSTNNNDIINDIGELSVQGKQGVDNNNIKLKEVRDLVNEGLSTDEIAHKLNIGKGEVILIKELYLK